MMTREESWIALAEILGHGSPLLKPLLGTFEDPMGVFAADASALRAAVPEIGQGTLASILQKRSEAEAVRISRFCHENGVQILTMESPAYPSSLRELDGAPAVLYCRGRLPALENRLAVGVVGTRKADVYGEQVTYKLSFELAAAGAVIVSGMAAGLDGIAAAAALNAGGETIAVLGCGIDITYPKQHTRLASEIAERGAIITEYAPGTMPYSWNFPMRNRIISGLSSAILVTEAADQSGSLITARYGTMQGKTVFAVPGDITAERSAGCNRLLQEGALPAITSGDVLSQFRFLYRETLHPEILPEAAQYAALTPEALRPYRLRTAVKQEPIEMPETTGKSTPKSRKKRKKDETYAENVSQTEPKVEKTAAPDTSLLTARQSELYALLPDAPFSVDVLTAAGVPVAEALATLTILELYGLLRAMPGGLFEKK